MPRESNNIDGNLEEKQDHKPVVKITPQQARKNYESLTNKQQEALKKAATKLKLSRKVKISHSDYGKYILSDKQEEDFKEQVKVILENRREIKKLPKEQADKIPIIVDQAFEDYKSYANLALCSKEHLHVNKRTQRLEGANPDSDLDQLIDITIKSTYEKFVKDRILENRKNLRRDLSQNKPNKVSDYYNQGSLGDLSDKPINQCAQEIFESHYLQPFESEKNKTDKGYQSKLPADQLRLPDGKIQRKSHGVTHAARVGIWIPTLRSLYADNGNIEARKLSVDDIKLIQIAAIFHDATRQNDGVGHWDDQSANKCYDYFMENGIDAKRARFFSDGIRHKDIRGKTKSIVQKLIHDSDCLEIMRNTKGYFELQYVDFYKDHSKFYRSGQTVFSIIKSEFIEGDPNYNSALGGLLDLSVRVRQAISNQGDLGNSNQLKQCSAIAINSFVGTALKPAIDKNVDPELKRTFEHAQDAYGYIAQNVCEDKVIDDLYHRGLGHFNLHHNQEEAKEEAEEEVKEGGTSFLILKPAEQKILKTFKDVDWVLHHSVANPRNQDLILGSQDLSLKYVHELKRNDPKNKNIPITSTPEFGGVRKNIFLGFGARGFYSSAGFTQSKSSMMLEFDVKKMQQHDPEVLKGLLVTGHAAHYKGQVTKSKGEGEAAMLGGVAFEWTHSTDKRRGKEEYYKRILYKQKNGEINEEFVRWGDEFSDGVDLTEIGLKFIKRLRLLGQDNALYQHLLKNPDDKVTIAKAMEEMFRVDDFEFKLPLSLKIDPEYTRIILDKSPREIDRIKKRRPQLADVEILSKSAMIQEVYDAISVKEGESGQRGLKDQEEERKDQEEEMGQVATVKKLEQLQQKGYPMDGDLYRLSKRDFPIIKAMKEGNEEALSWLMRNGANSKCFEDSLVSAWVFDENKSRSYVDRNKVLKGASVYGYVEVAKALIGGVVHYSEYLLHYAAKNGHKEMVDLLVSQLGLDLESSNPMGKTPLALAIQRGHAEVVEKLIKLGAKLEVGEGLDSPLMLAIKYGHFETFEKLIELGANLETKNKDGNTPLLLAVKCGYAEMAGKLMGLGVDTGVVQEQKGSLLIRATKNGYKEIIEFLNKEFKIDLKVVNGNGDTLLTLATKHGHAETIGKLIELGADLEARNSEGESPLMLAVQLGHADTIEKLIELGADAEVREACLDIAEATSLGCTRAVKKLIELRDDVNQGGRRPLIYVAAQKGHAEIVKILAANGADINKGRKSPLYKAVKHNHAEIVEFLAFQDDVDLDKSNPLQLAAQKGNMRMVQTLVDNKADVNQDKKHPPIYRAAQAGHAEIVKILAANGADINKGRKSPLYKAVKHNHAEIVEFLAFQDDVDLDKSNPLVNAVQN